MFFKKNTNQNGTFHNEVDNSLSKQGQDKEYQIPSRILFIFPNKSKLNTDILYFPNKNYKFINLYISRALERNTIVMIPVKLEF